MEPSTNGVPLDNRPESTGAAWKLVSRSCTLPTCCCQHDAEIHERTNAWTKEGREKTFTSDKWMKQPVQPHHFITIRPLFQATKHPMCFEEKLPPHTLTLVFSYSIPKWKEGERTARRKVQELVGVSTNSLQNRYGSSRAAQGGWKEQRFRGSIVEPPWKEKRHWNGVVNSSKRRYARVINPCFPLQGIASLHWVCQGVLSAPAFKTLSYRGWHTHTHGAGLRRSRRGPE